jgi:transposase InsO family protein
VRSPRRLSLAEERPIIEARLKTGLGPGRLAWIVRRARSTIWKVLHRHGLSRYRREPAPPARRYEWSRPGALLHVDVAKLARFQRPGHKILGRSQATRKLKSEGAGHVCVHVAVDDNSRYAYVEQHPDELGTTTAAFLARAIDHFVALGCAPPDAVMTDNAFCYSRSRHFKALLARHHIRHITIPPYTPRWNGKAERFIQTLKREWAYAHTWANSTQRARALNSYLRTYNRHRPHSSLDDRPPISRIHNLRGQNS